MIRVRSTIPLHPGLPPRIPYCGSAGIILSFISQSSIRFRSRYNEFRQWFQWKFLIFLFVLVFAPLRQSHQIWPEAMKHHFQCNEGTMYAIFLILTLNFKKWIQRRRMLFAFGAFEAFEAVYQSNKVDSANVIVDLVVFGWRAGFAQNEKRAISMCMRALATQMRVINNMTHWVIVKRMHEKLCRRQCLCQR